MKRFALAFAAALFAVTLAVPATTWAWYFKVYNQTGNKIEAGVYYASGDWSSIPTVDVPSKQSVDVSMRGGYCLDVLYLYTPYCRQPSGKFMYYINCLGTGSSDNLNPGATCCWNVNITVEEYGEKGSDGLANCRVRTGTP